MKLWYGTKTGICLIFPHAKFHVNRMYQKSYLWRKLAHSSIEIAKKMMPLMHSVLSKATDMSCSGDERVTVVHVTNLLLCVQPKVILRET